MTIEEFESLETDYAEEFDIGESHIILNDLALVSNEYDLTLRQGLWCEKNADGEWESDWAFTLIHKTGDSPENYLYLEQGGIFTTLHNYARMCSMDVHKLYDALGLVA